MSLHIRDDYGLEEVPVAELVKYDRNARTHSEAQVLQICDSVKEFGWTNPLLIDENDVIIAGHGRLAAAQKLGMEVVPCIRLQGLDDDQKRALVIADNQLALNAGWDDDILRAEVGELDANGFDTKLLGFSAKHLGTLLGGLGDDLGEDPADKDPDEKDDKLQFRMNMEQIATVMEALSISKLMGEFVDPPTSDENASALVRVCETFITQNRETVH